ncbi:MAG: class I SAM-dependent methyltransferase [Cyanomargarita calcarea GSE-NOS-MK-12-04C]|jgi:hypothetical protein|uniref:Class I SAM-dependent methyltransferase n=1 Tax=Cyanomargarita calcarea GSE-NOS-MK-12-04C TaxID=2839659 RepID=A0A951QGD9_9CYAN|nr:class I SAM-dependent methyltransferase [Cyanomargarita calcarea GSE-NOS-MK-12-04C]
MVENCPICLSKREICFKSTILSKYDVSYLYCNNCGLLQTEHPYWLGEAYNSAIADADTGLVARNISISKRVACILFFLFGKNGKYLDIAGGYGMLTRLMRDMGFDFYWFDLYCENILAKRFEASTTDKAFSAITAFEVLEHVYNPTEFIHKSLKDTEASTIIFSTELFNGEPPKPQSWWYYAFESGQHISFYQPRTLKFIADKLSLFFYSYNGLHLFTKKAVNNQVLLEIMTSRWSTILRHYVKRNLISKTVLDNKYIINNFQDQIY